MFDDENRHAATDDSKSARYVLHLAFPIIPVSNSNAAAAAAASSPPATPVLIVKATEFTLMVFSNCYAQTVITADPPPQPPGSSKSQAVPLISLYNRVSDNLVTDTEPCAAATVRCTALSLRCRHPGLPARPPWSGALPPCHHHVSIFTLAARPKKKFSGVKIL